MRCAMKKTIVITLKILAVIAIAATVAYAVYHFLNKEKKPIAVFESNFDDDAVESVDAEVIDVAPAGDGALDAVDKCMPY